MENECFLRLIIYEQYVFYCISISYVDFRYSLLIVFEYCVADEESEI